MKIIVNCHAMLYKSLDISHGSLLALLGFSHNDYAITYTNGVNGASGVLKKGERVNITQWMNFDVKRVDKKQ